LYLFPYKLDWSNQLGYACFEQANEGNKMGKNQWVTKRGDKWAVVGEGNSKAHSIHDTQLEAKKVARQIAINQQSELIVQGKDNKIVEKNSYGKDNFPPPG